MVEEKSRSRASSGTFVSGTWCSKSAVPLLLAGMRAMAAGEQCKHHGIVLPTQSSDARISEATASSSSPSGAGSISDSSCSTSASLPPMCRAGSLQLLLEAVVLYGNMGAFTELNQCFELIYLAACNITTCKVSAGRAELEAFVAARGHLLLRVLLLLSNRGVDGLGVELGSDANAQKAVLVEKMTDFITKMTYRSTDDPGRHDQRVAGLELVSLCSY